jgi:putative mRNA 3-end processing factor
VAGSSADAREDNQTCAPFEPVRCHCFITESTFGLPIYRWQPQAELFASIDAWWRGNAEAGRASLLLGYSFGKAQRILHGVDRSIGPILVHGAVEPLNRAYRAAGVDLPQTPIATEIKDKAVLKRALIVAPPSAQNSTWTRRFGDYSDAFASGWMQLRGARRRRSVDRGFVLSDHADWPGLQRAIAATGAERVIVTHGYEAVMVRWLSEQGLEASAFETEYGENDEQEDAGA